MRERILVVDDEEAIREIVCSMLVSASYRCQQAASGNKALAVLNSGEQFELVLTGLMMPDLDGMELLKSIKLQYPTLPVVFITGVHDVMVALACIRQGASDYLLKPFERRQLLATIRRALENHRSNLDGPTRTTLGSLVTSRTEELRMKLSKLELSGEETVINVFRLDDEPDDDRRNRIVTAFTIAIAHAMGLSREQIKPIARGAFLHDIGQVRALRDILRHADDLLPDELAIMCQLSLDIYEMLKAIPVLADASEIIYAYTECFDGTGYPRRLKGDEIPMGARILSVARTMDAFTEPRYTYRALQTVASACAEIQRWSEHQFDPEVVNTVLSMPGNIWVDLRKEA